MTESSSSSSDRIHFGSCHSHHYESPLWKPMTARNASAFVWVGDAIYGDDFGVLPREQRVTLKQKVFAKETIDATPERLHGLYQQLLQTPGYREYLQGKFVLGTFDDHDYGRNNGDWTFPYKRESALEHVKFLQESNVRSDEFSTLQERAEQGKGLYGVKVFDFARGGLPLSDEEAGLEPALNRTASFSNRSVAIFTLDCRSNKTPWPSNTRFLSTLDDDMNGDFLGEEQWAWFEEAIGRSTAAVNIVVQGLQVHADKFTDGNVAEEWSRFPRAQHRLYQALLKASGAPILVSGDVHMAEILRRDCRNLGQKEEDSIPRPLYEITTSGLTHSWGTSVCSRPKESSSLCESKLFNRAVALGMHWAHHSGAWKDIVDLKESQGGKTGLQYTLLRNFAEMEFDWGERKVAVRILGENSALLMQNVWDLDVLSAGPAPENRKLTTADFSSTMQYLQRKGIAQTDDWICLEYNGIPSDDAKAFMFISSMSLAMGLCAVPIVFPGIVACLVLNRRRKCK